jgi:hypothetical protein
MAKKEERATLGLDSDDEGEVLEATADTAGSNGAPTVQPPTEQPPKPATKIERRGRVRDAQRPTCPNCTRGDEIVRCTATSSRDLFTWYACDNDCGYRVKMPRPELNRRRPPQPDLSQR